MLKFIDNVKKQILNKMEPTLISEIRSDKMTENDIYSLRNCNFSPKMREWRSNWIASCSESNVHICTLSEHYGEITLCIRHVINCGDDEEYNAHLHGPVVWVADLKPYEYNEYMNWKTR